jgi:hypothetical protein
MAKSNPSWGYVRIQGSLANLGYKITPNTVKRILKEHGIEPALRRQRKTTWWQFLRSHWDTLAAADFFTSSQPNAGNGSAVECRERLGGLLRDYYRAAA